LVDPQLDRSKTFNRIQLLRRIHPHAAKSSTELTKLEHVLGL